MRMLKLIKPKIRKWWKSVKTKLKKNPLKGSSFLIISLIIIFYMGKIIYDFLGLITLAGYVLTCLIGIPKLIEKPIRTVVWGFSYFLAAVAVGLFIKYLIPMIESKSITASISLVVALMTTVFVYIKARQWRKY